MEVYPITLMSSCFNLLWCYCFHCLPLIVRLYDVRFKVMLSGSCICQYETRKALYKEFGQVLFKVYKEKRSPISIYPTCSGNLIQFEFTWWVLTLSINLKSITKQKRETSKLSHNHQLMKFISLFLYGLYTMVHHGLDTRELMQMKVNYTKLITKPLHSKNVDDHINYIGGSENQAKLCLRLRLNNDPNRENKLETKTWKRGKRNWRKWRV